MSEKTQGELLREQLLYTPKQAYRVLSEEEIATVTAYCEGYKHFLDVAKTEREAVIEAVSLAKERGFVPFDHTKTYKAGDRVYLNNRGKALILAVIGTKPIEEGVSIAAAHIDSPRLDLKPNPLYEDRELAYFDTHYYGGIKKYQWTAIPLALHGVIVRRDGTTVTVSIGEAADDPISASPTCCRISVRSRCRKPPPRSSTVKTLTYSSARVRSRTTRAAMR